MLLRYPLGNDIYYFRFDFLFIKLNMRDSQLDFQYFDQLLLRNIIPGDKHITKTHFQLFLLFQGIEQLLIRDKSRFKEQVADSFAQRHPIPPFFTSQIVLQQEK
ncbi:hypothetical protein D3C75_930680 [compost metagenome]